MQGPYSFLGNALFSVSELLIWEQLIGFSSKRTRQPSVHDCFKWHWTCLTQSPGKVQLTSVTRSQQRGGSLLLMLWLPHFPHSKLAKGLRHTDQHLSEMEHLRKIVSCQRSLTSRDIYFFVVFLGVADEGGEAWHILLLLLCQFSSPDDTSRLLKGDITVTDSPFQPNNLPMVINGAVAVRSCQVCCEIFF